MAAFWWDRPLEMGRFGNVKIAGGNFSRPEQEIDKNFSGRKSRSRAVPASGGVAAFF
jgi:hypothetical protein